MYSSVETDNSTNSMVFPLACGNLRTRLNESSFFLLRERVAFLLANVPPMKVRRLGPR